jgi:hypothetical protein
LKFYSPFRSSLALPIFAWANTRNYQAVSCQNIGEPKSDVFPSLVYNNYLLCGLVGGEVLVTYLMLSLWRCDGGAVAGINLSSMFAITLFHKVTKTL